MIKYNITGYTIKQLVQLFKVVGEGRLSHEVLVDDYGKTEIKYLWIVGK